MNQQNESSLKTWDENGVECQPDNPLVCAKTITSSDRTKYLIKYCRGKVYYHNNHATERNMAWKMVEVPQELFDTYLKALRDKKGFLLRWVERQV